MNFIRLLPVIISSLLLGAHFFRAQDPALLGLCVFAPLILLIRRRWVSIVIPVLLLIGAAEWVATALSIREFRMIHHQPWVRMMIILYGVAAFTAASGLVFITGGLRKRYSEDLASGVAGAAAFFLSMGLLTLVQLKMPWPGILLERYISGGGWLEGFWLSVYAAWLADKIVNPGMSKKWRPRVWAVFSILFFIQLIIGLAGVDKFLMTGKLHFPIPALIVAGPIYRGHGFFMLTLFSVTLLLVGPAWCSWLCYVGAWDDAASRVGGKPKPLPGWRGYVRIIILFIAIITALVLRFSNAPIGVVIAVPALFAIISVVIMVYWSRKTGTMAHCTAWCPIGVLSTRFGKVSPFRVKIDEGCNDCGLCKTACRYDALSDQDIQNRRPGEACTLCGDCIAKCKSRNIEYTFPGLSPQTARQLFLIITASLHAVFLGVARI